MLTVAIAFMTGCNSPNYYIDASGSFNGHDFVDLGLPSGTLWATCNIGAEKPEEFGGYFAWGETNTKSIYESELYKYTDGEYNKLTKYCGLSDYGNNGFIDNLIELQSNDDPATVNWGSGWETPSKVQWDELLVNTKNKWTTWNGVNGCLFTSKKNGQTFFLPAAGIRWGGETHYAGSYGGYYWSGSLYTGNPDYAWHLRFYSGDCSMNSWGCRYFGSSVRPVHLK